MRPIGWGAAALVILLLATGCDRVSKAARDLAGDDNDGGGRPPASAKPSEAHKAASAASSSSAPAIVDPSDTQVGEWHIAMTADCAAGKAEHMAHYDINGDGIPDTVCWHVIRSKSYGDYVEVDARVKSGDHEQSAYRLLRARPGEAMGLCHADHVSVRQSLWAQKGSRPQGLGHRPSHRPDGVDRWLRAGAPVLAGGRWRRRGRFSLRAGLGVSKITPVGRSYASAAR